MKKRTARSSCRFHHVLVARGLPCPIGLVRGGRRNTLVVKATFRLDGVNAWAATQAPLRETILDESGRRVFPSDFQAHKSALDVVIAGATLNAFGPVHLRVGRHQIFSDDPRSLGPVPLADASRESSFARPEQQLPLQEFPLQLEVVFAAARSLLSITAPPVQAALIVREDWSLPSIVLLNLDALLVDPMREVAELVFRGSFAETPNALLVVGPSFFDHRSLLEAQRWPRVEATEPRTRSVRETAFELDEDTFVADADSDATIKISRSRPNEDDESTAVHRVPKVSPGSVLSSSGPASHAVTAKTIALAPVDAVFTRALAAMPVNAAELPFARPVDTPNSSSSDESTAVYHATPEANQAELPFTGDSTLLLRGAVKLGPELPFKKPSEGKEAVPIAPPFQRAAARTMLGGAPGRAMPFPTGAIAAPRAQAAPPDAGLPFRHAPPGAIPLVATMPAPAMPTTLPVVATPATAVAPIPAIVVSAPVAASPATALPLDGLTIEQYAKIRSRLWQGEPRTKVLRENKMTELRFRLFERRLQRDLDALPPSELVKVLELLG